MFDLQIDAEYFESISYLRKTFIVEGVDEVLMYQKKNVVILLKCSLSIKEHSLILFNTIYSVVFLAFIATFYMA